MLSESRRNLGHRVWSLESIDIFELPLQAGPKHIPQNHAWAFKLQLVVKSHKRPLQVAHCSPETRRRGAGQVRSRPSRHPKPPVVSVGCRFFLSFLGRQASGGLLRDVLQLEANFGFRVLSFSRLALYCLKSWLGFQRVRGERAPACPRRIRPMKKAHTKRNAWYALYLLDGRSQKSRPRNIWAMRSN